MKILIMQESRVIYSEWKDVGTYMYIHMYVEHSGFIKTFSFLFFRENFSRQKTL